MLIRITTFEKFFPGRIFHICDANGNFTSHTAKIVNGDNIFDENIVYGVVESEALERANALPPVLRGISREHPIAQEFLKHNAVIRELIDYQYVLVQTEILDRLSKDETEYARKRGGADFLSSSERWIRNYLAKQDAFIQKYSKYSGVEIQEDPHEFRAVRTTTKPLGHRLIRELIKLGVPFEGRHEIPDTFTDVDEWHKFNQFGGFFEDAKKIIDPILFPPIVVEFGVEAIIAPYTHLYLKRKSKPVPIFREKPPVVLPNLNRRPTFIRKK